MATGSVSPALVHPFSHCASDGHTRAHTAPSGLACLIKRAAPTKLRCAMRRMKPGISIPTGQPLTHGASWQNMHLPASAKA